MVLEASHCTPYVDVVADIRDPGFHLNIPVAEISIFLVHIDGWLTIYLCDRAVIFSLNLYSWVV